MILIKLYIFRATFTRTPLGDFLCIKMFIGDILYIYIIYDIIYEIIYKKAYNSSFHQNLEKIQYILFYKRNFQKKSLPRIRISRKKKVVSKTLLFL